MNKLKQTRAIGLALPAALLSVRLTDGGKKLDVRGYIGVPMLGRSQTWVRQE